MWEVPQTTDDHLQSRKEAIEMQAEASTTKRWKITGDSKKGFVLNEWVPSIYDDNDKFRPLEIPHDKMKLREAKDYLLQLHPNYRIYTNHGTKGREFWGFVPESSEFGFVAPYSLCKECDRKHDCPSSSYKTRHRVIVCGWEYAESVINGGERT